MHLESDWNEDDIFNEIRSVFSEPMNADATFLQMTGAGTKSLVVPALSSSFKWTPKEVAGRADSTTIYILCKRKLKNEVQFYSYLSLMPLKMCMISYNIICSPPSSPQQHTLRILIEVHA